jgi:hypothetical protein
MPLRVIILGQAILDDSWIDKEAAADLEKEDFCELFAEDPISFLQAFSAVEVRPFDWKALFDHLIENIEWVDESPTA